MKTNLVEHSNFWNYKSARLHLTLTCSLAIMANGFIRNTLNMAIVCMVKQNPNQTVVHSDGNETCMSSESQQNEYQASFDWNSYQQGLLLSALFFGGLTTAIPAGWMADRYNPKLLVTVGIIASTVCCVLCPIVTYKFDYIGLFVLRFIMGAFNMAFLIPATSAILARWIPPVERSTAIGVSTAGSQLSLAIGMPLNAFLCGSSFLGGWPAIFYVNGAIGAVSLVFWILFASNRADTNKFISEGEKNFIVASLSQQNLGNRKVAVTQHIPWNEMIMSPAILSCAYASVASGMTVAFLQTYIPTYYKQALHLNLTSNGLFTALPFLCQMVSKVLFGMIADMLKKKTKISHTLICKIFDCFATSTGAALLVGISYVTCSNYGWAVASLSLIGFTISAIVPGFQTSLVSIAPAYSGIMNSFSRFIGQISAVTLPFIISTLTPHGTAAEWRHLFTLIAILMSIQFVLFFIFGSTEIQSWAMFQHSNINSGSSHASEVSLPATEETVDQRKQYKLRF